MVLQGERVLFIGKVALFSTKESWDIFIAELKKGISDRRTEFSRLPRDTWPARITVDFMDRPAIERFARERQSLPYPGYAAVFLNNTAVRACDELKIAVPLANTPDPVRPEYVTNLLDEEFIFYPPTVGTGKQ